MMAFIAKLIVQEGREREFEDLQKKLAKLAHDNEPDLLSYDVIKQRETERTYIVYAAFADEAAFNYHMGIDFHEELVPPILDCLAEEMDLTFYDGI